MATKSKPVAAKVTRRGACISEDVQAARDGVLAPIKEAATAAVLGQVVQVMDPGPAPKKPMPPQGYLGNGASVVVARIVRAVHAENRAALQAVSTLHVVGPISQYKAEALRYLDDLAAWKQARAQLKGN